MAVYPRGKGWQANFMIKGSRFRELFESEVAAQTWELEVRAALKAGLPAPTPRGLIKTVAQPSRGKTQVVTLQQLADYTLKNWWRVHTPRSIGFYETNVKQLLEFLGRNTLVTDITRQTYSELIAHFKEKGNSNGTIDKKMATLSKMMSIAQDELEIISRKPKVPFLKAGGGRIRYLKEEEERAMLETLELWGDDELADLIKVAIDTGFRSGEIFNIQWMDFDDKMSTLTCWQNKSSLPRTNPLTTRAREVFVRLRGGPRSKLRTGGPFVHLNKHKVRYRWERLITHLGLDDVVFHTLRHTTASRLVQRGVDLRRVQVFMGHKSIQTTLLYAKLAPNSLVDAARALEPRDNGSDPHQNPGLSAGM